jgi:hypothetical protein
LPLWSGEFEAEPGEPESAAVARLYLGEAVPALSMPDGYTCHQRPRKLGRMSEGVSGAWHFLSFGKPAAEHGSMLTVSTYGPFLVRISQLSDPAHWQIALYQGEPRCWHCRTAAVMLPRHLSEPD